MKNTTKTTLTCILIVATVIINTLFINSLKGQLSDCRFECNHLQTKLSRLQELSDYVPILEQILNSQQLAELKVCSEIIQQKRYREYERVEQSLLNHKN